MHVASLSLRTVHIANSRLLMLIALKDLCCSQAVAGVVQRLLHAINGTADSISC